MNGRVAQTTGVVALTAMSLLLGLGIAKQVGGAEHGDVAANADVNARKPDGSTPLQWAVYDDNVAEVQRLIKAGADVSVANNYGASPVSLAAEVANTAILKLLLDAGADAD